MLNLEHVEGTDKGQIVLYGLSTCGWCRKVKTYLENQKIGFSYIYVDLLSAEDNKAVMEEMKKWNSRASFPTLVVRDEKAVIGYNEDKIREAVGINE